MLKRGYGGGQRSRGIFARRGRGGRRAVCRERHTPLGGLPRTFQFSASTVFWYGFRVRMASHCTTPSTLLLHHHRQPCVLLPPPPSPPFPPPSAPTTCPHTCTPQRSLTWGHKGDLTIPPPLRNAAQRGCRLGKSAISRSTKLIPLPFRSSKCPLRPP